MPEKKRIYVLVKTYPTISEKYAELVCTAGVLEDGSWMRMFPMPFRLLNDEQKYPKYAWIQVEVERNTTDFRPESYRPVISTLVVEPKPDKPDWDERRRVIFKAQCVYTARDVINFLTGISLLTLYITDAINDVNGYNVDDGKPLPLLRRRCVMADIFNIYCDESCHLENDAQRAMVLGAIWCPWDKTREIAVRLREIKQKHGIPRSFEVKWTKVSAAKKEFYLDLVDYFFDDDDVRFRCLVVPDKSLLRHSAFSGQTHDAWYYKMYFDMLKVIFNPNAQYRIYLDIKDTCGSRKAAKLHEVLCHSMYDFSQMVIKSLQLVRSHEIEQIQLADLLIGAVSYLNRGLSGNSGKMALIDRIQQRSRYSLNKTTLLREEKMNIFVWHATENQG
jgi:hypothetical protein